MLKRLLLENLKKWRYAPQRRPLLLRGARQTGKSWLLKTLGREAFKHTAYFDLARQPEVARIFESTRDPAIVLRSLQTLTDIPLIPHETLIVFDEIQVSSTAFGALKYFSEDAPEYAVAAAGSLLGVAVRHKNLFVPVGQVQMESVWPLSFQEFCLNVNPRLYAHIDEKNNLSALEDFLWSELTRLFQAYLLVGGMPQAVNAFVEGASMDAIHRYQDEILALYRADFSQYTTPVESARIASVWEAIPRELAKPNSRFFVSHIKKGARSREYAPAVSWLEEAGLIMRVKEVSTPKLPLSAYQANDTFKIYMNDIGLLNRLASLTPDALISENGVLREWKGVLVENWVAMSLREQQGVTPSYWTSGNTAEVDFVIGVRDTVLPIEVKAGENVKGRSLSVYRDRYEPLLSVRFSMKNFHEDANLINIPLPLADWGLKFIELALANKVGSKSIVDPLEEFRRPLWP